MLLVCLGIVRVSSLQVAAQDSSGRVQLFAIFVHARFMGNLRFFVLLLRRGVSIELEEFLIDLFELVELLHRQNLDASLGTQLSNLTLQVFKVNLCHFLELHEDPPITWARLGDICVWRQMKSIQNLLY